MSDEPSFIAYVLICHISHLHRSGHYCPELANLILTANAPKNSSTYINMKGLLVGNPGTENDWYELGQCCTY